VHSISALSLLSLEEPEQGSALAFHYLQDGFPQRWGRLEEVRGLQNSKGFCLDVGGGLFLCEDSGALKQLACGGCVISVVRGPWDQKWVKAWASWSDLVWCPGWPCVEMGIGAPEVPSHVNYLGMLPSFALFLLLIAYPLLKAADLLSSGSRCRHWVICEREE